jgi:DUF2993 family protein
VRRLVLLLVVLVGLAAVADRVAALGAERVVGERIQQDEGLAVRPDVTIGGFPFLTQAFRGRYDDVTVNVRDLRRGPVVVSDVQAHLTGVHVPFSDVVRQKVNRVRIDNATAEIDLDYSDLNTMLGSKHVRFSEGTDGHVHVSATGSIAGVSGTVGGDVPVTVQGDSLVVQAGLNITIPLPSMPFGIQLKSARATANGITVVCTAHGLVVRN